MDIEENAAEIAISNEFESTELIKSEKCSLTTEETTILSDKIVEFNQLQVENIDETQTSVVLNKEEAECILQVAEKINENEQKLHDKETNDKERKNDSYEKTESNSDLAQTIVDAKETIILMKDEADCNSQFTEEQTQETEETLEMQSCEVTIQENFVKVSKEYSD